MTITASCSPRLCHYLPAMESGDMSLSAVEQKGTEYIHHVFQFNSLIWEYKQLCDVFLQGKTCT